MKPAARQGRWRETRLVHGVEGLRQARRIEIGEALAVDLLDHAEAAELALVAVPIALVIAKLAGELAAGDLVDRLEPGHDLNWEGQPAAPARLRSALVLAIEARGGRV